MTQLPELHNTCVNTPLCHFLFKIEDDETESKKTRWKRL